MNVSMNSIYCVNKALVLVLAFALSPIYGFMFPQNMLKYIWIHPDLNISILSHNNHDHSLVTLHSSITTLQSFLAY